MSSRQAWASGGMIFAATLMIIIGIFQVLTGIAAIIDDEFFVVGANYTYEVDTTAWGWIHLGIGALAVAAGFALFSGRTWARAVAIVLAVLSATANFFFVPYYPFWALLIIATDIFVIWAVATARTDVMAGAGGTAMTGGFAGEPGQSRERWPAENVPTGRHWAQEPAKEGTAAAQAQQQAQEHAGARTGYGQPPGTGQPPGGAGYSGPQENPPQR